MPEISNCSLPNNDLMSIDPDAPATPPAPPAPAAPAIDANSCYACADAATAEPRSVVGLITHHDGGSQASLLHCAGGDFSADLLRGEFQSNQDGAALGVSLLRTGFGEPADGPIAVEVSALSAGVAAGLHNADGSSGYHAGAHAALAHGEATAEIAPGWSVSFGGGVGVEAEGSLGLRDADGDGRKEICARAAFELMVGVCFEPADVADAALHAGQAAESTVRSMIEAFEGS